MSNRIRVLVVVCALVLSGGAAWAQPGPTEEGSAGPAWSEWAQVVKVWLAEILVGVPVAEPTPEWAAAKPQEPDEPVTVEQTCEPGWETCSADPNG